MTENCKYWRSQTAFTQCRQNAVFKMCLLELHFQNVPFSCAGLDALSVIGVILFCFSVVKVATVPALGSIVETRTDKNVSL